MLKCGLVVRPAGHQTDVVECQLRTTNAKCVERMVLVPIKVEVFALKQRHIVHLDEATIARTNNVSYARNPAEDM